MAGWLEQRTRIPFVGIIAIVVIVGIVAVFLRSGLSDLLPESKFTVTSASDGTNAAGSASFRGERAVPLTFESRLEGILVLEKRSVGLSVDAAGKRLYTTSDGLREEILLERTQDGLGLTATFEYDGLPVVVTVYPSERTLDWRKVGGLGTTVQLVEDTQYSGRFLFNGKQYTVRVEPGRPGVVIRTNDESANVNLRWMNRMLVGTWRSPDGASRPVEVDLDSLTIRVSNLW